MKYTFKINVKWEQSAEAKTEKEARLEVEKTFYEDYGIDLTIKEIKLLTKE